MWIVLIIAIIVLGMLVRFLPDYLELKAYEKSAYFEQTELPYGELKADKGAFGEYQIYKELSKIDGYYQILFNCYIYKEDGDLTEVDVLFLHESGLYVIESKNYKGWIFGSENQQNWTQSLPLGKGRSQKVKFFNPIIQNKVHIKWLSYYLHEYAPTLHSLIVFGDKCTLKEINLQGNEHQVIQLSDILATVEEKVEMTTKWLTDDEIDKLYHMLLPLTKRHQGIKDQHIEQVKQKQSKPLPSNSLKHPEPPSSMDEVSVSVGQEQVEQPTEQLNTDVPKDILTKDDDAVSPSSPMVDVGDEEALLREIAAALAVQTGAEKAEQSIEQVSLNLPDKKLCPKCQSDLVLRKANKGERRGQEFWGCSRFPKCRFIERIDD